MQSLFLSIVLIFAVDQALGNGRLWDPVGRSSAWRRGFNTPHNYDDNSLYCGGLEARQAAGDKCGVCGDPYGGQRPNEPPNGQYATGTIVKDYREGQVVSLTAEITANHGGWFEYRICPHNDVTTPVTQDCLDKHVLQLANGQDTRVDITNKGTGYFKQDYLLPAGMTCTQCVVQWKYHSGNSWGCFANTTCCIGCGIQEEWYGCADVSISLGNGGPVVTTTSASVTPDMGGGFLPISPPVSSQEPVTVAPTTSTTRATTTTTTQRPTTTTARPIVTTSNSVDYSKCVAINLWSGDPTLDQWCRTNCAVGKCPPLACRCGEAPITQAPTTARPTTTTQRPTTTTTRPTTTTTRPTTTSTTTSTTTPRPTTTTTTRTTPTTTTAMKPTTPTTPGLVCTAINLWAGNVYLDKWCTDACGRGKCPLDSCSCTGPLAAHTTPDHTQPPTTKSTTTSTTTTTTTTRPTTTTTRPTTTSSTTTPTTTTTSTTTTTRPTTMTTTAPPTTTAAGLRCVAINSWAGNVYLDKWCTEACRESLCPQDTCLCSNQSGPIVRPTQPPTDPPTTTTRPITTPMTTTITTSRPAVTVTTTPRPTTTTTARPTTTENLVKTIQACKAIDVWADIDVFDRWCMDECAKDNCPKETCLCVDTALFPVSGVITCSAGSEVSGAYWDSWCQGQCDGGSCPVNYCNCALG